ncbi:unnamed protein product [Closterium sp. NIES-53]
MKKKKPWQIDVANAFLYAPVDAEIYVELPHGSHGEPNQVCQLQKSLYGIKQAPRLWQQYLHARLTRIGFRQLPHDQGMYRLTKGDDYILLIVYVDDLLYIGSTDNVTRLWSPLLASSPRHGLPCPCLWSPPVHPSPSPGACPYLRSLRRGAVARRSSLLRVSSDRGSAADSSHGRVLIDWIRVARLQLREHFGSDFPVLRLHSDRGGEFSSDLLRAFCRAEGIRHTFTLLASPQQNGIAERRIGMINLQPRVSLPETSLTLRWTGKVGDASAFRVWGSRAFVRDLSADKLSSRAVPCVFLGFPPDAPDPVEPVEVAVDSGASGGAEPAGVEPGGAGPGGAEPESVVPGGAGSWGAGCGGAEPERAEPGGAGPGGAEPGVAESGDAPPAGAGPGGPSGALSRRELPSPQELREWFARRWIRVAGAGGAAGAGGSASAGGTGSAGPGGATGAGVAASAGGSAGAGAARGIGAGGAAGAGPPVGAGVGVPGVAGGTTGAGGAAGVGADSGGAGIVTAGSGGAARPRPYFVPLLEQVLGLPHSSGPAPSLECPPPVQSESQLQLAPPLPAPSPYAGPTGGLAKRREPESRPASLVRTARPSRRVPHQRPPAVPGTHPMALRPSTAPQRVPLPSPLEFSLPALADPESDSLRAASPTVTRFLATTVTDHSFESAAASALVAKLVDFAAQCRIDYATSLVAGSASVCPPSVGGECALSTDVFEDRQEEF